MEIQYEKEQESDKELISMEAEIKKLVDDIDNIRKSLTGTKPEISKIELDSFIVFLKNTQQQLDRTYEFGEECPYVIEPDMGGGNLGTIVAEVNLYPTNAIVTIDNPHHHALSNDKWGWGNNQEGMQVLINLIESEHRMMSFEEQIKFTIEKHWAEIYRNKCRELGLSIT